MHVFNGLHGVCTVAELQVGAGGGACLVVAFQRLGHGEVHDKSHVWLVDACACACLSADLPCCAAHKLKEQYRNHMQGLHRCIAAR